MPIIAMYFCQHFFHLYVFLKNDQLWASEMTLWATVHGAQAWQSEFNPWDPHGERREWPEFDPPMSRQRETIELSSLTSIGALHHLPACTHSRVTHTHTYILHSHTATHAHNLTVTHAHTHAQTPQLHTVTPTPQPHQKYVYKSEK